MDSLSSIEFIDTAAVRNYRFSDSKTVKPEVFRKQNALFLKDNYY